MALTYPATPFPNLVLGHWDNHLINLYLIVFIEKICPSKVFRMLGQHLNDWDKFSLVPVASNQGGEPDLWNLDKRIRACAARI